MASQPINIRQIESVLSHTEMHHITDNFLSINKPIMNKANYINRYPNFIYGSPYLPISPYYHASLRSGFKTLGEASLRSASPWHGHVMAYLWVVLPSYLPLLLPSLRSGDCCTLQPASKSSKISRHRVWQPGCPLFSEP